MKPHVIWRDFGAALVVAGILEIIGVIPTLNIIFGLPSGVIITVVGIALFVFGFKGAH